MRKRYDLEQLAAMADQDRRETVRSRPYTKETARALLDDLEHSSCEYPAYGIHLRSADNRYANGRVYRLWRWSVNRPGQKTKLVYAGTDCTLEYNIERTYKKAVAIRREILEAILSAPDDV